MNQALEISKIYGFDPEKSNHLAWVLGDDIKKTYEKLKVCRGEHIGARYETNYLKDGIMTTTIANAAIAEAEMLGKLNTLIGIETMLNTGNYCSRCGYLDDTEVTYDERCSNCGGSLPI